MDEGQLPLWGRDRRSIAERFAQFHRQNPQVWSEFERLALMLISKGRSHYSADAILHVIRFNRALTTTANDNGFKINNDFTSRYARMFTDRHPQHADFFQVRKLTA